MSNSDKWGLFSDEADRYDATVELVTPYYRMMHEMLVRLAVESAGTTSDSAQGGPILALDIGSGTGADSVPLLQAIPTLRLLGVDRSAAMHTVFAQRALRSSVSANRFRLMDADILDPSTLARISDMALTEFGSRRFGIITSAFTLHHFAKHDKETVFRLIHDLLAPGGVFLLGDLFSYEGESDWLTKTLYAWETSWLAHNFDKAASTAKKSSDSNTGALKDLKEKWLRHYQNENHLNGMTTQLNMLKDIGFSEAGNPFRYWQVGLIAARK